ncbi:MAG: hypothetical protein ACREPL_01835 [Rhodanobacteraceae bacterium]
MLIWIELLYLSHDHGARQGNLKICRNIRTFVDPAPLNTTICAVLLEQCFG